MKFKQNVSKIELKVTFSGIIVRSSSKFSVGKSKVKWGLVEFSKSATSSFWCHNLSLFYGINTAYNVFAHPYKYIIWISDEQ